jgi:hypothetical protein
MGLFDKKKKDEFDSPNEMIDLSQPTPAAPPPQAQAAPEPAPKSAVKEAPRPKSSYGIDQAIELMRTLPAENVELVVQVVKHTLESTNIDIGSIIEDATSKQGRIEARIKLLKEQIADLEAEIKTRRDEIDKLDADHQETSTVKERLVLAEKLTKAGSAKPTPAAKTTTSSARPSPIGKQVSGPTTVHVKK